MIRYLLLSSVALHNDPTLRDLQWARYEEGFQKGTQSHDRLVEHSHAMTVLADILAEGKEEVEQVRDGTLDPTECSIRACPQGHLNKSSRQGIAGSCKTVVQGKNQCNQSRHFMTDKYREAFLKLVDECLPTNERPLQGPPLLRNISNRVSPFERPTPPPLPFSELRCSALMSRSLMRTLKIKRRTDVQSLGST